MIEIDKQRAEKIAVVWGATPDEADELTDILVSAFAAIRAEVTADLQHKVEMRDRELAVMAKIAQKSKTQ